VRDVHHWRRDGLDVKVALNCAPPELLSGVLMPRLYQHLAEWDVPGDRFVLEVTEDSFLAEPERARSILLDVQDHGLEVAIDDYGTGFSSLTYLRDLPVHELKIDRSFVNGILTDPRSRVIVLSTGQLAHGLGMRSVAEGVEDGAMAAELVTLGIDVLQGYSISAPIPADRVQEWVADWNTVLRLAEDAETLTRRRDQESSHDRDRGRATRIRGGHRPTQPRAHEA
jgi:EAL domain-containing protein (putative c-di-GMP-specific phosphodiesterase class I)